MLQTKIQKEVGKFFNNLHVNQLVTIILIFVTGYITIETCIGVNFLQPLKEHPENLGNEKSDTSRTIFTSFVLLCVSMIGAKTAVLIRLPALFGALIIGIIIGNVETFNKFFILPPFLSTILRKLALVNIVIRWGLTTDTQFLANNFIFPTIIGLVSAVSEIIAVTAASYFILKTTFIMSIFCGIILVIVSPAVTVPAMIDFKSRKLGSSNKIPENVLAICCVDNLFCVIAFMILSSLMFINAPIATTILMNIGTIILGIIGGLFFGWLLCQFPRPDTSHTQFSRITLLGLISTSMLIGTYLIKYVCSGLIATLILNAICAKKWKTDNKNGLESVESTYKFIWDSALLPLLFALLGMNFDISSLTINVILLSILVISIGLIVRSILILVLTLKSKITLKEHFVLTLSLLPRATFQADLFYFQADLAPTLLTIVAPYPEYIPDAALVLKVAVISVLMTAPIFDILLNRIGPKLLRSLDVVEKERNLEGDVFQSETLLQS